MRACLVAGLFLADLFAASCSAPPAPLFPPTQFARDDAAVVKARRSGGDTLFVLFEVPQPLDEIERPRRFLERHTRDGAVARYTPPDDVVLADFAAHPSGAVSLLFASDAGYAATRWPSGDDRPAPPVPLVDDELAGDPSDVPPVDALLPPRPSRDAGRVAPLGEALAVVVRTATASVVAYRLEPSGARTWRRLVEPGVELDPTLLLGGSFDTFGQLAGRYHVHIDSDGEGTLHIAIPTQHAVELLDAHARAFGELLAPIGPTGHADIVATTIASDGTRGPTRVVGTPAEDEPYGARVVGGSFFVLGRTETHPNDAGGWDGLVVEIGAAAAATRVDVDRGEVLFDAAPASDGGVLFVGGAGYSDNPSGASISEECALLAVVRDRAGRLTPRTLPAQPRHSHLRTALSIDGDGDGGGGGGDGAHWVAGLRDGPGTHSGDLDRALIRGAPFVALLR